MLHYPAEPNHTMWKSHLAQLHAQVLIHPDVTFWRPGQFSPLMEIPKDCRNKQHIIAEGHSFEDINVHVSRAEWEKPSMVNWSSITKPLLDISESPLKRQTTLYFPLPRCREQSVDVCGLFLTLVCSCMTAHVMHPFILNLFLWSTPGGSMSLLIYMMVGKPTHVDHTSAQVNSHARRGQECFGSL